jgi:DNA-binding NtrC family response regulator
MHGKAAEAVRPAPNQPPRLLVADECASTRNRIRRLLEADPGLPADAAADGRAALEALVSRPYRLVLVGLRLPEDGGLRWLEAVRGRCPPVPVIVLSPPDRVAEAFRAARLGAYDVLPWPAEPERLRRAVGHALQEPRPAQGAPARAPRPLPPRDFHGILSLSPAMHALFDTVERLGRVMTTMLLQGETGTGKELMARALHLESRGRTGPFVGVNCAAVPATLLESEFFGHEAGAFTDATGRRAGRFELAAGGTLFLDEVDALPPAIQAKFLRVLQERCFERVGGTDTLRADVRVVAASHRPLARLVAEGQFREDLYYRLNIVRLDLPPLRERAEDIPHLARHFAARHAAAGAPAAPIAPEAMEALRAYAWPGNIRQLENAVERACVGGGGATIRREHLPGEVLAAEPPPRPRPDVDLRIPLDRQIEQVQAAVEECYLRAALRASRGNLSRCAAMLGMSRRWVSRKIAAYHIDRPLPPEHL